MFTPARFRPACCLPAGAAAFYALLALCGAPAHAGGFIVPAVGTKAMGRGGANTANPKDLTALWWNPAGLMNNKGELTWTLNVSPVDLDVTFDRTDEGDPECELRPNGCPKVTNGAGPFWIPFIGIGSDFGLEDFAFAFGLYGPYTGRYELPAAGPQRYSLVKSSVLEIHYTLAVAWQPFDWLRIGGSLQNVDVRTENQLTINAGVIGDALGGPVAQGLEDPFYDIRVTFDVQDNFNLSGNIGVTLLPFDWLVIGASFQPGVDVRAKGDLKVRVPEELDILTIEGSDIELGLDLPPVVRLGVAAVGEGWDVELDYVWEGWSTIDEYDIKAKDITVTGIFPIEVTPIPRNWKDSFTISLGGEYEVWSDWVSLRGGYFFDERAVPPSTFEISVIDGSKHGIGVGATVNLFGWAELDLAYSHIWIPSRTVTGSNARQVEVLQGFEVSTVGNGKYTAHYDIVSMGIRGNLNFGGDDEE